MRVFLSGATGYVGSVVAEKLTAAGCDIVALARSRRTADLLNVRHYTVVVGDLVDPRGVGNIASECDSAVHCAFPCERHEINSIFDPGLSAARKMFSALQVEAQRPRRCWARIVIPAKPLVVLTGAGALGCTGCGISP